MSTTTIFFVFAFLWFYVSCQIQVGTFTALKSAIETQAAQIDITGSISFPAPITIPASVELRGRCSSPCLLDGKGKFSLFIISNSGLRCTFSDLNFTNGYSSKVVVGGGAITINGNNELDFNRVSFWNNRAFYNGQSGGAIFASAGILKFQSCSFYKNSASSCGGGIFLNSGSISVISSTFTGNKAWTDSAPGKGGAVFVQSGLSMLRDNSFVGNNAIIGGALYLTGQSNVSRCSFINHVLPQSLTVCSASGWSITPPAICISQGGSLYVASGTNVRISDTVFATSFASYGGSIYSIGQNVTMFNVSFSGAGTGRNAIMGGAIQIEKGIATLTNCKFLKFAISINGGALLINKGADAVVVGCKFLATGSGGAYGGSGGAFWNAGRLLIFKSSFISCSSIFDGGVMVNTGTVYAEDTMFQSSTAASRGGVLFNSGGIAYFKNCQASKNSGVEGGVIYSEGSVSKVTLENVRFTYNSATNGGSVTLSAGNMEFKSCVFTSNKASGNGGALSLASSSVLINNCTFDKNQGKQGGDVNYEASGAATFTSSMFKNSKATSNGGSFYIQGNVRFDGCKFSGCQAANGACLYNDAASTIIVSKSLFESGAASNDGGAVYLNSGAKAQISDCTFRGNNAMNNGGAVYTQGIANLYSSLYFENSAVQEGNDVCVDAVDGGVCYISACSISPADTSSNLGECMVAPTLEPSPKPTPVPTKLPTFLPSPKPSSRPSSGPTPLPSAAPSPKPSAPSALPTWSPTLIPTSFPTNMPTEIPSHIPSLSPSPIPTLEPTAIPTFQPTPQPSPAPSVAPTYGALHSASTSSASEVPDSLPRYFTMPSASFSDLGSSYRYFLSVTFAATGWTNGASGAYATVSVAGKSFQCRPGNSCNKPSGASLELCQANIEISPAVLAAAGGILVIQARIDNANVILTPACKYQGSGIFAQYTIQGSHGMPTAAPTNAAPLVPGATLSPTPWPTLAPTSPSPAPTPQPTMGTRMRVSQSSGAVVLASGLLGSIAPVTFSGLGSATTYYLSVGVYGTSFGGNSDANFASLSVTVSYGGRDTVVAAKCNPGDSCPDPQLTVCAANVKLSPPFSPSGGGSVVLKAATVGFLTTRCTAGDSNINVTYTLQGSDPMPTFAPSAAPTGLAPSSLLAQTTASTNAMITGTGALFYVIAAVAALFAVLSVLLAQNKQTRPAVYQISLLSGIVAMTLVGSAFASEMFLVDAMLGTPSGVYLGYVVLLGRALHLPATCYLLHGMFGGGKTSRLGSFLDLDLIFGSAKLFGAAALFSFVDVTVVRFFPWLSSPFSRKTDGFPTSSVFRVCVITKLVQSVVTVTCQVIYFALVNSAVTADTPQARQSLAFLCVNMATTILLVVLNAFEFIFKGSFLKGGEISDVPDEDSSYQNQSERRERGPSHLPSLPPPRQPKQRSIFGRFSQRLSFSDVFAPAVSDSIPQPLSFKGNSSSEVTNPMMQSGSTKVLPQYESGSTKQSFSSTQSQDIEMVLAREQEMKAEIKALAQQNAQMQEQFGAMMAMMASMSAKLGSDKSAPP